ncbi:hypothetical protein IMZ48_08795 [Candidatus Bathyarchaeota archaeon]|nr:hypothetical protein [Candidatus Bathyarchaeota archaeon]
MVPEWEGKLREITDFASGWIVQDNNLLQASSSHIGRVFEMLHLQKRAITFGGGLDARLLSDGIADGIRGLRIEQLFLASDTVGAIRPLARAIKRLHMPLRKVRVYTLLAYNGETIDQATERLETILALGALPFAQLYQPPDKWIDYPREWRLLARTWSRPAAMLARAIDKQQQLSIGIVEEC